MTTVTCDKSLGRNAGPKVKCEDLTPFRRVPFNLHRTTGKGGRVWSVSRRPGRVPASVESLSWAAPFRQRTSSNKQSLFRTEVSRLRLRIKKRPALARSSRRKEAGLGAPVPMQNTNCDDYSTIRFSMRSTSTVSNKRLVSRQTVAGDVRRGSPDVSRPRRMLGAGLPTAPKPTTAGLLLVFVPLAFNPDLRCGLVS